MNQKSVENGPPLIGIIMGSVSDWTTMRRTAEILDDLDIEFEAKVVSAHRSPNYLFEYASQAEGRGITLIIAGAGGAAHLPGMAAAKTIVPVIGVPVIATPLKGLDALLSIMQMPAEVGVATVGVGSEGAARAALFAATILARKDDTLYAKLLIARKDMAPASSWPKREASGGSVERVSILVEREQQFELMQHGEVQLKDLGISFSRRVIDPSTSPEELARYTRTAAEEGTVAFIAGCDNGIGLACNVARTTMLPVLGVPIVSGQIDCLERFLQPFNEMPSGVATFAIGRAGAINAALFTATFLSVPGSPTRIHLDKKRNDQECRVREATIELPTRNPRGIAR